MTFEELAEFVSRKMKMSQPPSTAKGAVRSGVHCRRSGRPWNSVDYAHMGAVCGRPAIEGREHFVHDLERGHSSTVSQRPRQCRRSRVKYRLVAWLELA
jgi:hypothetical protein